MKLFLLIGFLAVLSAVFACNMQNKTAAADIPQIAAENVEKTKPAKTKPPVLVELFTSEGCSDCPPADRVLARLENEQPNSEAEIITLALHVDYWNRLGWTDPFSSHAYSERQSGYADRFKLDSIYTPQMVVDGQKEFVGSNFGAAQNAVSEAAKNQKAKIEISNADAKTINVKISDLPAHETSYVWFVTAEDDLQTAVKRGENGGKTLSHTSVAREMKLIGEIKPTDKTFETQTAFEFQPNWNRRNLKFIVFAQGENSKQVYGVNKKTAAN